MIIKHHPFDKSILCEGVLVGIAPYEEVSLLLEVYTHENETLVNVSILGETDSIIGVDINVFTLLKNNPTCSNVEHYDEDLGEKLVIKYVDNLGKVSLSLSWEGYDDVECIIPASELTQIVEHFETVANIREVYNSVGEETFEESTLNRVVNYPRETLEKVFTFVVDYFK